MRNLLKNKTQQLDISSKELTLEKIVLNNDFFNIPIYQRLYVWGDDQIKTLLEDLKKGFEENANKNYYLGAIMLTKNEEKFDLIDGQQRFTTLWLIAKVLKYDLEKFIHATFEKVELPRISFSVRDFANRFFKDKNSSFTDKELDELRPISKGLSTIDNFIKTLDNDFDKEQFATYIFKKVKMVATEMPKDTDENKVFEAMNNRGVQLQQHEILKSKLLSKVTINIALRNQYSLLWDACSIMDNYLEKNIKDVANLTWKKLFDSSEEEKTHQLPEDIISKLSYNEESIFESVTDKIKEANTLLAIIKSDSIKLKDIEEDEKGYDAGKVRSIISFPMLLLHTFRIYQYRHLGVTDVNESAEVKGKDLIRIFKSFEHHLSNEKEVTDFINLLWKVRKNFDQFIIKWSYKESNKEEIHLIKKLYQNETAFQRRAKEGSDGFALLQSMLYHSQQLITHYWLTPLLNKSLDNQRLSYLYRYLRKLDNEMFCNPKRDLRTMSYEMMSKGDNELKGNFSFIENELISHRGTGYPSYWFYKLEFILWKNRKTLNKENRWEHFRMTAKNSVEHVSPQNPKEYDKKKVWSDNDNEATKKRKLDDFGNLVLLTSSMNSENSNKTFNAKKTDFKDKNRIDPLKSDLIFSHENWNWDLCQKHRNQMINLFKEYLE
jgi:uncharacterized protein with ParB-like and HNH nuclease domain